MDHWDMNSVTDIRGKDVFASDGEKIGSVKEIFYDEMSGEPEWVGVGTSFLGMKERVVPLEFMTRHEDRVLVGFATEKIQNEPDFDTKEDYITSEDEIRLSSYFGLSGQHQHSPRVLREGDSPGH